MTAAAAIAFCIAQICINSRPSHPPAPDGPCCDAAAAAAADVGSATYTSTLGNIFMLNTTRMTQRQAAAACNLEGGQLVSYETRDEQVEVETFFTQRGFLLPSFHKTYWLGLSATTWPQFSWADRSQSVSYQNWGDMQPNRAPSPGLCSYANYTLSKGSPPAWGWDDTNCDSDMSIFMCKKVSAKGSYYTSKRFANTYIFNSTAANFTQAEMFCRDKGAHLVAFATQQEQVRSSQRPVKCYTRSCKDGNV